MKEILSNYDLYPEAGGNTEFYKAEASYIIKELKWASDEWDVKDILEDTFGPRDYSDLSSQIWEEYTEEYE